MSPALRLYTAAADEPTAALGKLPGEGWIGIDTEFMREHTYFAELCLIQIATGAGIFCVDPVSDADKDPFWKALFARPWVLHSGRQDIEVLYQTSSAMPQRLFDTQIAAALLGFAQQIGYAGLVRELFGHELPKSHTRADWSQRPLPQEMLQYASDDVRFLLEAREMMEERLAALGRESWVEEDSAALLAPGLYEVQPDDAVARLKAARNLRGPARRAAVALARWREQRALRANRPRQWIMRDAALVGIANTAPTGLDELGAIEGVPPATVRRSGRELLRLVAESAKATDRYQPPAPPSEHDKARLKAMQAAVAVRAEALGIASETLAAKKELSAAVSGNRDSRLFTGWRREVIGQDLLELLE